LSKAVATLYFLKKIKKKESPKEKDFPQRSQDTLTVFCICELLSLTMSLFGWDIDEFILFWECVT